MPGVGFTADDAGRPSHDDGSRGVVADVVDLAQVHAAVMRLDRHVHAIDAPGSTEEAPADKPDETR